MLTQAGHFEESGTLKRRATGEDAEFVHQSKENPPVGIVGAFVNCGSSATRISDLALLAGASPKKPEQNGSSAVEKQ